MSEEYFPIEEARDRPGLRVVLMRGFPSPWSQAFRGILHVKGIAYDKVHLGPEEPREALSDWTGQDSFPAAMFENERARTGWEELLWLAERLAPEPALVPADPEDRVRMFGLAREICGERGLGWSRRTLAMGLAAPTPPPGMEDFAQKYGSSPAEGDRAKRTVIEVLNTLTQQLARTRAEGHRYLMGAELSALDVYWATFCNLLTPLEAERMPSFPEGLRASFTERDPEILSALDPSLIELRDHVYETHLELPVEL